MALEKRLSAEGEPAVSVGGVRVAWIEPETELHIEARSAQEPEQGDAAGEATRSHERPSNPWGDRDEALEPIDVERWAARAPSVRSPSQQGGQAGKRKAHEERHDRRERDHPGEQDELPGTTQLAECSQPATQRRGQAAARAAGRR